jgi:hypothetical protein
MQDENEKAVRAFNEWFDTAAVSSDGDDLLCRESAQRAWQAALQSQVSNTDGWVMVPAQATREMLNAAVDVDSFKLGDISPIGFRCSPQQLFERCYAAMLSAAPKAPQQVSNTPQDAIGYVMENYTEFYAKHGQTVMTPEPESGRIPVYTTPPQQQEQSGEAVDAYNLHCETCNGHGFVTYSIRHGESDFEDFEQECPVCDGAGKAPKHVQDLQARYQEVRSELHALNTKIGMESLLGPSPTTPTATASQESTPTRDQTGREPT